MGSHSKRKKGTGDTREIISNIKTDLGQDATRTAMAPSFEGAAYMPRINNSIDFVNVTSVVDPAQSNAISPPSQVTNVNVTTINENKLDVNWDAQALIANYKVFKNTVTGFTPGSPIAQPTTNLFHDIGLSPLTAYYYRVSAVNTSGMEGAVSAEATGTTSPTPPPVHPPDPDLWLAFDNNYNDSSGNGAPVDDRHKSGNTEFTTANKFGGHGIAFNVPSVDTASPDRVRVTANTLTVPNVYPDHVDSFSYSLWIEPKDISSLTATRLILSQVEEFSTPTAYTAGFALGILTNGELCLAAWGTGYTGGPNGVIFKRFSGALTINTWYHVVITWTDTGTPATSTLNLYKDKVKATLTTSGVSFALLPYSNNKLWMGYMIRADGQQDKTYYEGYLDELHFYQEYVLSQAEVDSLYNTNGL